jgi:ubiquinone/menaquinone biosynthesis C-methylase UbiE
MLRILYDSIGHGMNAIVYDTIGKTYDTTRKADPAILSQLLQLLHPLQHEKYLDIGCGSGNYTGALARQGLKIEGLDISEEMLGKARRKYPEILFHQGDARALPFTNEQFHGATCILAAHHIDNLAAAFSETYRILQSQAHFILFTATPQQMKHYWLNHYFPNSIQLAIQTMSSFEQLRKLLQQIGFSTVEQIPFFVTNELQDWFLQSGKYRPEIYLDPMVRQGISTFHLSTDRKEISLGLEVLEKDIATGHIETVIQKYESTLGDYLFISARKDS